MLTIRHQVSLAEMKPVAFTPRPITAAPSPSRSVAPAAEPWYTHRYANARQNGRLAEPLRATAWHVRWQTPLPAPAIGLLRTSDRIVVEASGWRLLSSEGTILSQGTGGRSAASLAGGLFYLINTASYLEARHLQNGDLSFQSPLLTNERFAWPLLVQFGDRLLMTAVEQAIPAHEPRPGTRSEIDLLEFDTPLKLDQYQQILSLKRGDILHFDKAPMVFAAGGNKIYAAASHYLVIVGSGLEVESVFEAEFTPVALSVDEAGYMYLIVETGGRKAYWVVSPDGKRVIQAPLAPEHQGVGLPPVVAHNHQSYLLAGNTVLAYSPEGKLLWQHPFSGLVAGASVTADDKLLVSAGSELMILDAGNQLIGRHQFPGEQLTTAPVLTRPGGHDELLVATNAHVYSLVPE